MRSKVKNREELLNVADNYTVQRYSDGRINAIEARKGKLVLDKTQALYTTIAGLTRLSGVNGFLFPEVWNSLETPELNWFDRNPLAIVEAYDSGGPIVPHVEVERWTYTVPAGRKCFIESSQLYVIRETVSAAPDLIYGALDLTLKGGTKKRFLIVAFFDGVVGVREKTVLGQALLLFEGDTINGSTADYSTGGTVGYFINVKGTEFEA